jgi:hypothetical protein
MKKTLLFAFIVFLINAAVAASPKNIDTTVIHKSAIITWSIGYGYINLKGYDWNNGQQYEYNNKELIVAPFYLKYEKQTQKRIIGINLAYGFVQQKFMHDSYTTPSGVPTINSFHDTRTINAISLMVRLNKIFISKNRFDFYYGLGLGIKYDFNTLTTIDTNDAALSYFKSRYVHYLQNPIAFELTGGVRWRMTNSLGLYAEVGEAKSVFQFGIFKTFQAK